MKIAIGIIVVLLLGWLLFGMGGGEEVAVEPTPETEEVMEGEGHEVTGQGDEAMEEGDEAMEEGDEAMVEEGDEAMMEEGDEAMEEETPAAE